MFVQTGIQKVIGQLYRYVTYCLQWHQHSKTKLMQSISKIFSLQYSTDIDECDSEQTPCPSQKECFNTIGSFKCLCKGNLSDSNGSCVCKCFQQVNFFSLFVSLFSHTLIVQVWLKYGLLILFSNHCWPNNMPTWNFKKYHMVPNKSWRCSKRKM